MAGFIASPSSWPPLHRPLPLDRNQAVSPRTASPRARYARAPRMSAAAPPLTTASPMEVAHGPGAVVAVHSPEEFEGLLAAAATTGSLLVVDFHAQWCRKCKYLLPRLRKLAAAHSAVYFATVDVNAVARLPREYKIEQMPTFILFRDQKPVYEYIGGAEPPVVASTLAALVEEYSTSDGH